MKVFRVKGTTDEVTTCELCGRDELKGTVVLEVLDAEGNGTDEFVYYGAQCGAKAAGWTTREIRKAATDADQDWLDLLYQAWSEHHEWKEAQFRAQFIPWVFETYGIQITQVADLWDYRRQTGKTPVRVRAEFESLTAA